MNTEEFKQYLDAIIERAFKEGVIWKTNGNDLCSMNEAIKNVKEKILECK